MISAGNPNALPSGHEDNDVPTFWLLLKASDGLLRYQGYNKDLGGCRKKGTLTLTTTHLEKSSL